MDNRLLVSEPSVADYVVKNRLQAQDEALHGWYRFVLGYPPHLVREYLTKLGADSERDWVLDPFCGTAATPVEARLRGFAVVGMDANPMALLATRVKLNWAIDLSAVQAALDDASDIAFNAMRHAGLATYPNKPQQLRLLETATPTAYHPSQHEINANGPATLLSDSARKLIPEGFISPKPLVRVLSIRYGIETLNLESEVRDFLSLALATTIVSSAGNVGFGPEVYRLPAKDDADVLGDFRILVSRMIEDMRSVQRSMTIMPAASVSHDDARALTSIQNYPPIGIVITSPPYPNEKDYTRSTRLESVLLGLISSKADLRAIKANLLRSNTRNVFVSDDDDQFVRDIETINKVADEIEAKRITLGKTSGFERLYHRVTRLYFGGMYRHLQALLPQLRKGAKLAYVVGDQMSYFRIPIFTARLLADVATKVGYQVEGIELWRTRRSTTTKMDLDEHVLILKRC